MKPLLIGSCVNVDSDTQILSAMENIVSLNDNFFLFAMAAGCSLVSILDYMVWVLPI